MKKESELNAIETFGMLAVACFASATAVGLVLKKLQPKKPKFYGFHTSREDLNNLMK